MENLKQPENMADYKIGYCKPPNRFSATNQPIKKRGPSIITCLEQILKHKKSIEDIQTGKKSKKTLAYIVAMREVLNACEGDQNAIEDIIDRIDGKVNGGLKGDSNIVAVTIKIEGADGDKIQASQAQSVASFQR